jgi:DinB superfamily
LTRCQTAGMTHAPGTPSARSEHDDLVESSDQAWRRLRDRTAGMCDDEYFWEPGITTMAWRVAHVRDMLAEERNWTWLGQTPPGGPQSGPPESAATALAGLTDAYERWRDVLIATTDLSAPVGPAAGHYRDSTRRAFVHHVLDELIHHGAEIAMLRDLYAARKG